MSLSHSEFLVLTTLRDSACASQRALAAQAGLSLGTVNSALRACERLGYVAEWRVTPEGVAALEPYRVKNAIIMAAGLSSRFAPLSYERPKGVLEVRGEVLIERQIRQLNAAGISDITVVVGYKKEAFFYLEDRFGVRIVVNEEYATRNNHSTLMLVRERLGNTYVCSSDNYFSENVFEPYVYSAYYATTRVRGETDEYCVRTGAAGRITGVEIGGSDALVMLGHVYFDARFSEAFVRILVHEYDRPETRGKLWEDIYMGHLDELGLVAREYPEGVVHEFDKLDDLLDFDADFVHNVGSSIFDNICTTLGCRRGDISGIHPIKEGLTNLSFRFTVTVDGTQRQYVYRHPGVGTDEIINRESEAYSQSIAKRLGIDQTFIFQHPTEGWKLSHYLDDCVEFDYHDPAHVTQGLDLIRGLHRSGERSEWSFSLLEKAEEIIELLGGRSEPAFPDFADLVGTAERLGALVAGDGVAPSLCHNDFYAPNFLVHSRGVSLIDWEYSAMSDYASDLGTFICCSDYSLGEAKQVIAEYFEGEPTPEQMRHSLAYVSLSAFYWFVWALYKESTGDPVGEWLYLWYRATKTYGEVAERLYAQSELVAQPSMT